MRRPRSKLQVSTFPFLAVLLCAMGALLLLLFIMDRRAKIAAQYTVAEAVAERKKRSKEEEEARQAEWEKARILLHQSLLEQQNQLLGDAKGVQLGLSEADSKLALVQSQHVDLDAKIKAETNQIAVLQLQIASQNANLKDVSKKDEKSKAELLEAAKELAELEQAFRRLKALHERDKEVYSVVPYRGKRGDLRPPIYVECVGGGVIFHPEKRMLQSWEFNPNALCAEVERRTGPLALAKPVKDAGREIVETRKVPYVLFLIRPDGIASYYKAQAGLKGYQLDFGYELVDEDWVLDFNGDPNVKQQPGTLAKSGDTQTPKFRPSSTFVGGGGAGLGGPATGTLGNGGTRQGGSASGAPGGNGGGQLGGIGTGPGGSGPGTGGNLRPPGIGNAGTPGTPPYGFGNPSYRSIDTGIPVNGPTFVPISRQQQPIAIASSGSGDPSLPFSGGAAPTPRPDGIAPLNVPTGPSGGGGLTPGYPAGGSAGTNRVVSGSSAGVPGEGGSLPPITMPIPGSNVGGQPGGSPSSPGQNGQPGGSPGSPGEGGHGQDQGGDDPIPAPRLPAFGPDAPKKPPTPASPLSKLLGNKDFVITINCYAEHVTVSPSGLQYRWDKANAAENDRALVQTVTNLIARRQASVRAGEPPYRPLIRFQVPPDGYPTYYRAYPLLEHLQVPMTKENTRD